MTDSHELLNRLQLALDKLGSVVPQDDHERQASLKNARMWIAMKKHDGEQAVVAFEELVGVAASENAPPWLAGNLLAAVRNITPLLPDAPAD